METTETGTKDKISSLPDSLVVYILGLIPTAETIRTGVLSKRWECLWKQVTHLKFDSNLHQKGFSDHVTEAVITYQNNFFESLTITVSKDCDPTEMAIWLGIALLKKVKKVVLRLNELGQGLTFPEYALQRTNVLSILKVMGNINFNLPVDSVSLLRLRELHLYHVSFQNENSVAYLLEGCPVLEVLVLDLYISSGVSAIIVNVPSLLRLSLAIHACVEENIVVRTPRLRYLNNRKLDGVDSFIIEAVPELKEATLTRHEEHMHKNILAKITSAQCLSLAGPLKHHTDKDFVDLTSLEVDTKHKSWCNLLSYMLSRSPKLQSLKLNGGRYGRWSTVWIEPPHVATCLLTHLRTLDWEDFIWDGADDRNVAIHILKNGAKLRSATFKTIEPPTVTENQQRQTTLSLLANVERASSSCQIYIKESSFEDFNTRDTHDPDLEDFIF